MPVATDVPGGRPELKSLEKLAAFTSTPLATNEKRLIRNSLRVLNDIIRLVSGFCKGPTQGKKTRVDIYKRPYRLETGVDLTRLPILDQAKILNFL